MDIVVELPADMNIKGGLVIGPKDMLVLRISPNITEEGFERFRERLAAMIPNEMRGRVIIAACEDFAKVEAI